MEAHQVITVAHHGAVVAYHRLVGAYHGAVEAHQVAAKAHKGAMAAHHGPGEAYGDQEGSTWRPGGLNMAPRRLRMALGSHHDGHYHRFGE